MLSNKSDVLKTGKSKIQIAWANSNETFGISLKLNSVLAQIFGAPFHLDWIKCINQISYIEDTQSCDWL